jgi:hypothetical protein
MFLANVYVFALLTCALVLHFYSLAKKADTLILLGYTY